MNCYFSGIIGLALLGASISTLSVCKEQQQKLKDTFDDDLDKKYEAIIEERRNHYIIGLVLGMVVSFLVIRSMKLNRFNLITLFFAITLGIAVLFYMLMPKSDYMLNHLKTEEENKKWLDVYKTMQKRYYVGFVLGALASIPLANMFCKKD
jgi:hypothetical protein